MLSSNPRYHAIVANWQADEIAINAAAADIELSADEIAWLEMKTEEKRHERQNQMGLYRAGQHCSPLWQRLRLRAQCRNLRRRLALPSKADAFGAEFGATKCYGSYEALVNDPDVDVVYVGTPHNYHKPHTLLSLNAGKPVLCEKPFAVNAAEAREMVACAREKNSS